MQIDINAHTPFRSGTFSSFVSSENRCTHVGENKGHDTVRHFQMDGGVLPKGKDPERCDYLLLNDSIRRAYFIELKGSDLTKAISQIEASVAMIAASLPDYSIYKRIIYHTGTKAMQNSDVLKWKMRNKGHVVIKETRYEESINQSFPSENRDDR